MKKIAISGPESTGKSRLAIELANAFSAAYVEEYARTFFKNKAEGYSYSFDDITLIAKQQAKNEDAVRNENYLFCDTDILVCKIWQEFVFGYCDPWIENEFQTRHYDLFLICDIDLPWEYDPLREHPDKREILLDLYLSALKHGNKKYIIISGKGKDRTEAAIKAVQSLGK